MVRTCAFHGVPDVAGRKVVQHDELESKSSGLPLGVEPNQVLRQDGSLWCVVGWCDVVRPWSRAEAVPRPGHPGAWRKARREGTRSTPRTGHCQGPHQAIPATDGGASRCGEARRRSDVHVVRTMISEVPASRGGCP
jgi:hypothetical protein